jgi:hypothetical protein
MYNDDKINSTIFFDIFSFLNDTSLNCDKSVTIQNLAFLSYLYRRKRLKMHFLQV